jgi:hypothetical protein
MTLLIIDLLPGSQSSEGVGRGAQALLEAGDPPLHHPSARLDKRCHMLPEPAGAVHVEEQGFCYRSY